MQQPFVVQTRDHRPLRVVGEEITVLASGDSTGSYEIFLQSGPAGAGPPPHSHAWDEAFYVLSGDVDMMLGGESRTLSAGEFVHIPQGTVHTFRMRSALASLLSITSKSGASKFFNELHREVGGQLNVPKILEIASRHQIVIPPPPAS